MVLVLAKMPIKSTVDCVVVTSATTAPAWTIRTNTTTDGAVRRQCACKHLSPTVARIPDGGALFDLKKVDSLRGDEIFKLMNPTSGLQLPWIDQVFAVMLDFAHWVRLGVWFDCEEVVWFAQLSLMGWALLEYRIHSATASLQLSKIAIPCGFDRLEEAN